MIKTRINALRDKMKKENMDAYIIPTGDFHNSEYVGEYFRTREYMSGFTGSAGVLIITLTEAGLWTDGRYFIQAAEQLKGSGIVLFKSGETGVPDTTEYLLKCLPQNACIGFDGRVLDVSYGEKLLNTLSAKNISVKYDIDLVGAIWEDRPPISSEPAYCLDMHLTGMDTEDKLARLRKLISDKKADFHVITSLDDICWLLNIRGNDIAHNPVVLSYFAISSDAAILFISESSVSPEVRLTLSGKGITFRPYDSVYEFASTIPEGKSVLIDPDRINYKLLKCFGENVILIRETNPTVLLKAVKNETEIENLRSSHLRDGIAVTKFLYWIKNNIGKIPMTELSVSDKLLEFRAEQEGFVDLSFDTIAGYASHGAIIHYEPAPDTDMPLKAEGFLLLDSGGQYSGGTTDITRTIALGELSEEMRHHYTTVLRANLRLSSAKFIYGCNGANLDILSREPFWEEGLDYKHGTGHGVGYFLNVHEGPQSFNYRYAPDRPCATVLEEGMVITDEPGIYIEGSHGIRIENVLLCQKDIKNDYGQFMSFEVLTLAPVDLEPVNVSELSAAEKATLNAYHRMVFDRLSPYLSAEEAEWLRESTQAI